MHYFNIFFKKLKNALNFSAFGRKTQIVGKFWENFENLWWKFYRKIEFVFIFLLEYLLLKIVLGITPFFLNIFSVSRGGDFPLPPGLVKYSIHISPCNVSLLFLSCYIQISITLQNFHTKIKLYGNSWKNTF